METMLACRSGFSIGESIIDPETLVEKAKELGQTAMALTDTCSVTGLVELSKKAQKEGIKAIIGARLRLSEQVGWRPSKDLGEKKKHMPKEFFVTLYARTEIGLKAIYRLLTKANAEPNFYYTAKLSWDELFAELIILAADDYALVLGDEQGVHQSALFQSIVEDCVRNRLSVYLPLVVINTPYYGRINQISIETHVANPSVPLLALRPVLYGRGEADAQEIMTAVAENTKITDGYFRSRFNRDLHPMSPTELVAEAMKCAEHLKIRGIAAGPFIHKALMETDAFSASFTYLWTKQPPSLPVLAPDEYGAVVAECQKGFVERFSKPMFGHAPTQQDQISVYLPRLQYELSILKKLNFSSYFLNVQNIVRYAKDNNILVGPGRGSCFVAGSLVGMADGSLKPIETVEVGESVIAHDGSTQPVIDTYHIEKPQEIVDLEFDNGVKISCTGDHRFFTKNRGWVRADEIAEEDEFDDVRHL